MFHAHADPLEDLQRRGVNRQRLVAADDMHPGVKRRNFDSSHVASSRRLPRCFRPLGGRGFYVLVRLDPPSPPVEDFPAKPMVAAEPLQVPPHEGARQRALPLPDRRDDLRPVAVRLAQVALVHVHDLEGGEDQYLVDDPENHLVEGIAAHQPEKEVQLRFPGVELVPRGKPVRRQPAGVRQELLEGFQRARGGAPGSQARDLAFYLGAELEQFFVRDFLLSDQDAEALPHPVGAAVRNESPALRTGPDLDEPLLLQDAHRLAQGAAAGVKDLGEFPLGWQAAARLEAVGEYGLFDLVDDLLVHAGALDGLEHLCFSLRSARLVEPFYRHRGTPVKFFHSAREIARRDLEGKGRRGPLPDRMRVIRTGHHSPPGAPGPPGSRGSAGFSP